MSAQSFPIWTGTKIATAVIPANRFITFAGIVTGAGLNSIGVARTAAAIGEAVSYDREGSAVVETGAAVTAGAFVESDATGRAIDFAAGVKLGQAMQAATAAGQFIEVHLIPIAA